MDPESCDRLIALNRQFYQTFALQFSQTRQRIQPGVRRILERIPNQTSILDLGCGNGELWRTLVHHRFMGYYFGIDSSSELLQIARQRSVVEGYPPPLFLRADLTSQDWDQILLQEITMSMSGPKVSSFEQVLAFAVLHHIPGRELRLKLFEKIHSLLSPYGQFIHSEWQFQSNPKLQARIQPWALVDMDDSLLDPGDYLLDWRYGGRGFRYVHLFDESELSELAAASHFEIQETFYSDGENAKSGLYQVWTAVK